MSFQKYRRLWRRRMRRRPLLPVALIGLVSTDCLVAAYGDDNPLSAALTLAHVAIVAVWVTHARRGLTQRSCAAVMLLIAFLGATGLLPHGAFRAVVEEPDDSLFSFLRNLGAVVTAIALGIFGVDLVAAGGVFLMIRRQREGDALRWRRRFSITTLLWLTLLAAMLVWLGRGADWPVYAGFEPMLMIVGNAVVVASTLAAALTLRSARYRVVCLAIGPGVVALALAWFEFYEWIGAIAGGVASLGALLLLCNVRPRRGVQTRRASTRTYGAA